MKEVQKVMNTSSFLKLAQSTKKGSAQLQEEKKGKILQEKIIKTLENQNKSESYNDCEKFEQSLKNALDKEKIQVKKALLSDIQYALSEIDESAPPCKNRQGKIVFDTDTQDYERIGFFVDIKKYFEEEVLKYVKDAEYDEKDNKIGYEIPFTRHFYRYEPLRDLQEIDSDIIETQKEMLTLMKQ